jgi:collagenase-like PrtC family protease
VAELENMQQAGVDVVRVSPQPLHTDDIIDVFHRRLQGTLSAAEAVKQMESLMPDEPCDGYWHARAGIQQVGLANPANIH